MFGREKLLYQTETEFDHYQVVDMVYEGRKSRILFTGNRDAAFSGMPLDDGSDLLFDYIQRLFELVSTQRPKKVLLIGGGTYTLPNALAYALPDILIDVVEIDAGLDDIAEAFFNHHPSDQVTIHHTDGRTYLEQTDKLYDMILIDAFSGLKIPQSLADEGFATLLSSHLEPDGLVAMNILSSYKGKYAQPLQHFIETHRTNFKSTTIYPADSAQSAWMTQNLILISEHNANPEHHGLRFGSITI